jgi:predicted PurR-regulated permease PerM
VNPRLIRALFWLALAAFTIVFVMLLHGILMPFVASFVLAYLLKPPVDCLAARGVRRSVASLAILIAFMLALALVLLLLVPLVQGQIVLLVDRMPRLVGLAQQQFADVMRLLQKHLPATEVAKVQDLVNDKIGDVVTWIVGLLRGMITSSFAILSLLSLIVVTPVVTFFLLRDWHAMIARIDAYLPRTALTTIRTQFAIIDETLAGFIHGQAIVCVMLAAYYATALSLAGLDSAAALGLLIGVLAIIPVLGVAIGLGFSLALAGLQYGTWNEIFIVLGIFLFGQTVEANILTPKLVGDRIHLHPVWVIFALLAGGELFGILGVLVSVPAAAVLGVLVRFALDRYRRSMLYGACERDRQPRMAPFE